MLKTEQQQWGSCLLSLLSLNLGQWTGAAPCQAGEQGWLWGRTRRGYQPRVSAPLGGVVRPYCFLGSGAWLPRPVRSPQLKAKEGVPSPIPGDPCLAAHLGMW